MINIVIVHWLMMWRAYCFFTQRPYLLMVFGSRFVVAAVYHVAMEVS